MLSATHTRPGQVLSSRPASNGAMRDDFLFFRSFESRASGWPRDVRLLAAIAASGAAVAAKDVSMAGLIGSLAMLLEPSRLGVTVDLAAVPAPAGVPLGDWLVLLPVLRLRPHRARGPGRRLRGVFAGHGIAAAVAGELDDSGAVRLAAGGASHRLRPAHRRGDPARPLTGAWSPPRAPPGGACGSLPSAGLLSPIDMRWWGRPW